MKKLLPILLLLPFTASAQSSFSGEWFGILVALFLAIIIFIVFRELVMWYWKVNILIKNQEDMITTQQETNNLLSEQITLMKAQVEPTIDKSDI